MQQAWRRALTGAIPVPALQITARACVAVGCARAYARMGYIDELVEELSDRQRALLKLRFCFGRGPVEIQRHLCVSERVYRRELERALGLIAARLRAGCCQGRRAEIVALAAGVA